MADPAAFDRPELGALWTELRRRFEAVGNGEVRTVRLAGLGMVERSALADLLGLARLPGEPATVLVAGFASAGSGALATTLRAWAAAGQAVVVTLAQLRGAPGLPGVTTVHVVENSSVLAMAVHRFGPACSPDRTGALPWRMSTADYLEAVTDHGSAPGRLTDAPWDPDFAAALAEYAVAVPEEHVTSTLLDDLEQQGP